MQGIMLFSSVISITERRDMGLYEVPLSMALLVFGMRTMLANFHMCGLQHAREECESKRAYVLGVSCLVCQDLVGCYFYFVLLPLGPELW